MSLRRLYETTFIVNAALEDADIESVISKVTGYIENHGAEILDGGQALDDDLFFRHALGALAGIRTKIRESLPRKWR